MLILTVPWQYKKRLTQPEKTHCRIGPQASTITYPALRVSEAQQPIPAYLHVYPGQVPTLLQGVN